MNSDNAGTFNKGALGILGYVAVSLLLCMVLFADYAFADDGSLDKGQEIETASNTLVSESLEISQNTFDSVEQNAEGNEKSLPSEKKNTELDQSLNTTLSAPKTKDNQEGASEEIEELNKGLIDTPDGVRYVEEDGSYAVDTWKKADDANYYFGSDGFAVRGLQTINGNNYYFDNVTSIQLFGWVSTEDGDYYFKSDSGEMLTGLQTIYGKIYYLDPVTGKLVTGFVELDGNRYYFDEESGARVTGWQRIWIAEEERYEEYYFKSDTGAMLRGPQKIWGESYYLDPGTGARYEGWLDVDGNRFYFDEETGIQASGWKLIENNYYYFKSDTCALMKTGFQVIYGKTYYLDPETGACYMGWLDLDGSHYYFDDVTGVQAIGWTNIDGESYYFKSDTAALMYGMQKIWGEYYYLDPDTGARYEGWLDLDGKRYYFKSDTGARLTGWQRIYGEYYYFKSDTAALMYGLQKIYGNYYYLDPDTGARYEGWLDLDGKRYYFKSDTGVRLTGWQRIWGNYYYFGSDGNMYTGDRVIDGYTYHFGSNGICTNYDPLKVSMIQEAQIYWSNTDYLILVNRGAHKVSVFRGGIYDWSLLYYFDCVTGAPGTPTITGSYYTTGFKRPSLSTDSRAIYCTQIWGGYFFHSILASESELGNSLSHGCIRLSYQAASWIYNNIYSGTRVIIYN